MRNQRTDLVHLLQRLGKGRAGVHPRDGNFLPTRFEQVETGEAILAARELQDCSHAKGASVEMTSSLSFVIRLTFTIAGALRNRKSVGLMPTNTSANFSAGILS